MYAHMNKVIKHSKEDTHTYVHMHAHIYNNLADNKSFSHLCGRELHFDVKLLYY